MLTVIVQAGGQSRRMGEDKALKLFLGEPLVQRVINRIASLADEILVVTNRPADYAFLEKKLYTDILPERGALGGLYTALKIAGQPLVAVVACDMPFVSPEMLALQRDLLKDRQVDAVIPQTAQGIEPFHAIYRRSTCLPAVESVLEAGKWRVDSWMAEKNIHFLQLAEAQRALNIQEQVFQKSFWNLNTPEDFLKAEDYVNQQE
jgi:molybdopterin-guanine dinucleotide biosynthesis protein A